MVDNTGMISVQIICMDEPDMSVKTLTLKQGAKVAEVLEMVDTLFGQEKRHIDYEAVGIYGRIVAMDTIVHDGDRIEIYAPLKCSPEQSRHMRMH